MPVLSGGLFLQTTRINALIRDQSEAYQRRLPLRFLDRTAITPADDEEIIGTYTGKVYAADLIADDQAAAVYDAGQFEFTTHVIPNLKVGARITQSMMNRIVRMRRSNVTSDEVGVLENYEAMLAANLRRGVEERMNALICAMQIDSASYDRLGIKFSNLSWGTPATYKVTPTIPWTTAATATPVTDVLTLKDMAANDTGENYDRLTMGLADFRLMTATTEFRTLLPGLVGQPLVAANYNALDVRMQGFASQLLGMDIDFEDKTYQEQSAAGTITTTRVLPLGKVILSSKSDDGNNMAADWANTIVSESIQESIVGQGILGGEQYGPVAYYIGNENLNPPNITAWGVARGFPRKIRKTAFATLTVR